ncbi:MAG TPA: DUF5677 domain-containing protein [Vicinamibacterales bacterium]|nr:DUF5677 domain-containing protein [Vicinamibacterales bacterium]
MPVAAADHDTIVLALTQKAINTHAAIRILADAGHGDDAYALCRVLLENTVLLTWLLHRDPVFRLDLFELSSKLTGNRVLNALQEHGADMPEWLPVIERNRELFRDATTLFGNSYRRWARRREADGSESPMDIVQMFAELARNRPDYAWDVEYMHASWYVHSEVASLVDIRRRAAPEKYFELSVRAVPNLRHHALTSANVWMLVVLSAFDRYVGGELEGEIDRIGADMQAFPATPAS